MQIGQLFPCDIWHCILWFFDIVDLARVGMVNKNLLQIASHDKLWQIRAKKLFSMPNDLPNCKHEVNEFLSYRFERPKKFNSFGYSNFKTHVTYAADMWQTALCAKRIFPGGGTYRIGFEIVQLQESLSWHIVFGLVPASCKLMHQVPGKSHDDSHAIECTSGAYINNGEQQSIFTPWYVGCIYGMELHWPNATEQATLRLFQNGQCEIETCAVLSNTEYRFCIGMVRQQSAKLVPWCNVLQTNNLYK